MSELPLSISSAAAYSTARAVSQVQDAVAIKALKLANAQQESVANLVAAAAESIEALSSDAGNPGARLDITA